MKPVGISILSHKNERDRQTKKQNKVFFYKVKKTKQNYLKISVTLHSYPLSKISW